MIKIEINEVNLNLDTIKNRIFQKINAKNPLQRNIHNKTLVRYELMECFIRMGLIKIQQDNKDVDVVNSIIAFLEEACNNIEDKYVKVFGNRFRKNKVYTLGMSDCLKVNKEELKQVFCEYEH